MPQVTLKVPHQKLPILRDVLNALGIENQNLTEVTTSSNINSVQNQLKDSMNNIFRKYFSWEYYSNELEFE